ncbi:hypothetical protein OH77DRAFT_629585 [Trametes cingulata]|nr:hypothetical protein OH77DRAFT_629585 [Trametes cingulata]
MCKWGILSLGRDGWQIAMAWRQGPARLGICCVSAPPCCSILTGVRLEKRRIARRPASECWTRRAIEADRSVGATIRWTISQRRQLELHLD